VRRHGQLVGGLPDTCVIVARATTLVDVGRQHMPAVHERLAAVAPFVGTDRERAELRRAYAALPPTSFSSSILERCAPRLAVSRLGGVTWFDGGAHAGPRGRRATAPAMTRRVSDCTIVHGRARRPRGTRSRAH
jgi:hypothetical protein